MPNVIRQEIGRPRVSGILFSRLPPPQFRGREARSTRGIRSMEGRPEWTAAGVGWDGFSMSLRQATPRQAEDAEAEALRGGLWSGEGGARRLPGICLLPRPGHAS